MYGVTQDTNPFLPIIKVWVLLFCLLDINSYPRFTMSGHILKSLCILQKTQKKWQIISSGKLLPFCVPLITNRWANDTTKPNNAIVWQFPVEKMTVKGDILIKVYQHVPNAKKIYLFRLSFHTAFLESGVLELTEADVCTTLLFFTVKHN